MKGRRPICVVDKRVEADGHVRDHYIEVGQAEFPTGEQPIVATLELEGTMRTKLLIMRASQTDAPQEPKE